MRREQAPDVGIGAPVAVGDDRRRPGLQETGRVVVGALASDADGRLGVAGFGVPRCVAQPVEDDQSTRREGERRDRGLTVVLDVVVARPGGRVETEPVLGREERIVRIRARPAVAVTQVDDDRGPSHRRLDPRPGRVGAVDPDDVRGVAQSLGIRDVRGPPVLRRGAVCRPHDDHDLGVGRRARGLRGRHGDAQAGDQDEG